MQEPQAAARARRTAQQLLNDPPLLLVLPHTGWRGRGSGSNEAWRPAAGPSAHVFKVRNWRVTQALLRIGVCHTNGSLFAAQLCLWQPALPLRPCAPPLLHVVAEVARRSLGLL